MRATLLMVVVVSACGSGGQDDELVSFPRSGNIAEFSTYVQPVLEASCASLDCHGDPGRALRLYARDGLRLAASLRGQDASDDELMANIISIDGLSAGDVQIEDRLLLLKPLALEAGGIHHVGGELWADQNDPAYRCLHAWLRAGVTDAAGQAICARAVP